MKTCIINIKYILLHRFFEETRMKVTIIQNDVRWLEPQHNMRLVSEMIDRAEKSDIYVLPEMWNTGFCTDPRSIKIETMQQSLEFMQEKAHETNAVVCGSIAEIAEKGGREPSAYRNRFYFVRPNGDYDFYDKHHLFSYGGEKEWYAAGVKRVVATWKGWRFLLLVCYDLRFPIWARYMGDFDAIIVTANWPHSRIAAWDILAKARAIENQCYVVACNRVGGDPNNNYVGHSVIIKPDGTILASCAEDKHTIITAQLSIDELNSNRQLYRFLEDRDNK